MIRVNSAPCTIGVLVDVSLIRRAAAAVKRLARCFLREVRRIWKVSNLGYVFLRLCVCRETRFPVERITQSPCDYPAFDLFLKLRPRRDRSLCRKTAAGFWPRGSVCTGQCLMQPGPRNRRHPAGRIEDELRSQHGVLGVLFWTCGRPTQRRVDPNPKMARGQCVNVYLPCYMLVFVYLRTSRAVCRKRII